MESPRAPRDHWNLAYADKAETEVSWFQARPELSLKFILAAAPNRAAPIIDVGGGASRLVDELLANGFTDLTVLDISETALACSKSRLGEASANIAWISADITEWQPRRTYAIWHDRAVFHFLIEPSAQDAYIRTLRRATEPGALIVMATFALDGPERCSGLPVQRYSPETLAARLGKDFILIDQANDRHLTPAEREQRFSYAVLKRI